MNYILLSAKIRETFLYSAIKAYKKQMKRRKNAEKHKKEPGTTVFGKGSTSSTMGISHAKKFKNKRS